MRLLGIYRCSVKKSLCSFVDQCVLFFAMCRWCKPKVCYYRTKPPAS